MVPAVKPLACVIFLSLSTGVFAAQPPLSAPPEAAAAAEPPTAAPPVQADQAPPATGAVTDDADYDIEPAVITRILESKYSQDEKKLAVSCAVNHYRFWWSAAQIATDPKEQRESLFCNRVNEAYKRDAIFADCEKFQDIFNWDVIGDASEFFQVSTSCDHGHYVDAKASVAPWSCSALAEETGGLARLITAQAIGKAEICAVAQALNSRRIESCGDLAGAALADYRKQAALAQDLEAGYCAP